MARGGLQLPARGAHQCCPQSDLLPCALQTHRQRQTALPLHDPLLQPGHRPRRRGDQTTLPPSPREVRRDYCQQSLICLLYKFHMLCKRDSQGGGGDALPGNAQRLKIYR